MESSRWKKVLTVLCLSSFLLGDALEIFDPLQFDRKLNALGRTIHFINERSDRMNADVTLAITIVNAHLLSALEHPNTRYLDENYVMKLYDLLQLSWLTLKNLKRNAAIDNPKIKIIHETLNYPILWMWKIPRRQTPHFEFSSRYNLENSHVSSMIYQGEPDEKQNDECLVMLIQDRLTGSRKVPEYCFNILIKNDSPKGYPLAHRLLYIQIMRAFGYIEPRTGAFSHLASQYCSLMLRDIAEMEKQNFPYSTKDLFTEEVLLCGMEGFVEFTNRHYEELLLSWPHKSGCYSAFGFYQKNRNRNRRSTEGTDFGCDSHATGLSAAALALFLRKDIENAFDVIK